jgi:hypothetical protein
LGACLTCFFGKFISQCVWYLSDGVLSRYGLESAGDGVMRGRIVKNRKTLSSFGQFCSTYEFDCDTWSWGVGGVQRVQETSRYLDRLDVQKELFNVFINRAVGRSVWSLVAL